MAVAAETETVLTAEAAAASTVEAAGVGWWRHQQWRQRKWDNNDAMTVNEDYGAVLRRGRIIIFE